MHSWTSAQLCSVRSNMETNFDFISAELGRWISVDYASDEALALNFY